MSTPIGRWYWDQRARDINFVPPGRMNASHTRGLLHQSNTLTGALKAASRAMYDLLLVQEEREEREDVNEG